MNRLSVLEINHQFYNQDLHIGEERRQLIRLLLLRANDDNHPNF